MTAIHRSDCIPIRDLFTELELLQTYERFPSNICGGCSMLTREADSSGRLIPSQLGLAYVLLVATNPFFELVVFFLDYSLRTSLGIFSILLWYKDSTEDSTTLDRKQYLNFLYQIWVFRADGKTRRSPRPLIGWDIFDFLSATAEPNSMKLDREQDRNVLYQVCVFRADLKKRRPPRPLIGWDIFNFSSKVAELNSTKLDRKQDPNVVFQVCVFRADRKKKQVGRLGLWLAETFSTSPLKPLNRIQRDLTGIKISRCCTKFGFFVSIWKKRRWPPRWDIFNFSSKIAEQN